MNSKIGYRAPAIADQSHQEIEPLTFHRTSHCSALSYHIWVLLRTRTATSGRTGTVYGQIGVCGVLCSANYWDGNSDRPIVRERSHELSCRQAVVGAL
ncbi:hypothetical protein VTL71DRAFT_6615 [Oculimacula yallundae]|uniref:Uncharacterized protein n=1 Tax=Oculimacula yallundae TaxID=86028 RepID=A0ABR4BXF1_9HELO